MGATVDISTHIGGDNTGVVFLVEAFVTNTQGFVGCGNYARAIVTAVGAQTRVCDALVAVSHVSLVTNTQGFVGCGNYARAIVTAVGAQTRVCDALVAVSHVSLVTNTQGFIGGGNHAGTKAAAIDVCTG
jgi:hypothetical protein